MSNELDKYYTPKETALKCIELTYNTFNNITEVIEPSAGNGSFNLNIPNCIAYDIEPEHDSIVKQDFLNLDIPYKEGRLIIGNPPFGFRNNLSRSFYNHSCKIADYIGFILPISQMNNSDSLYLFNLVDSINLGELYYSGIKIHCCFNLYKRPDNGLLNKKPKIINNDFQIYRDDQDGYMDLDYDFAIYRRGSAVGKIRTENLHTQTYKILVKDKTKVDYIKDKIMNFNWLTYKKSQSAPSISKNDIYRLFIND